MEHLISKVAGPDKQTAVWSQKARPSQPSESAGSGRLASNVTEAVAVPSAGRSRFPASSVTVPAHGPRLCAHDGPTHQHIFRSRRRQARGR
jgi:hypothetical protein